MWIPGVRTSHRRLWTLVIVIVIGGFASPISTGQSSDAVVPFTISVRDATLTDLQHRLAQTRFPDEISDTGWAYGTNLSYLRELIEYWRDEFDWRGQERRLNRFDQFKTNIDGLDIHFIHQRSPHANALPLLLLNGWPSSIDEFSKVIGPLADPVPHGSTVDQAFHVVVPAMPGYGFSDKPHEPGFNPERMSTLWVQLMARLGYTRYGTHGTDWGSSVGTWLARKDADRMVGLHLTGCEGVRRSAVPVGQPPGMESDGFWYVEIQSTKPQTLGYGLSDSPAGLAAWIVEKYHWSDHDGDLEQAYAKDELLTNIMIYWVTNSVTSASRLYYESRHRDGRLLGSLGERSRPNRVSVPTGCASFVERYDRRARQDPDVRRSAGSRYNIVRWTEMPRGGHFPALEQPDVWLADVRAFFDELVG